MAKTKTQARRAPRPARRGPSTALVRRKAPAPKVEVLPALPDPDRNLTDEIMLGGLGLVDIKLTPEEEAVLAEPVNPNDVMIKPTGQPYLPHPAYTKWFGRAFGRLGWALVPVSKPMKSGSSVVCPYVLYIHGQPAAFANGEQEYFESNKDQTYGDALESTIASALRRCAKRLGVGLELWDRRWLDAFISERCVKVTTEVWEKGQKTDKTKKLWRLKGAPPFWNEVRGRAASRQTGRDPERDEPAGMVGFNARPATTPAADRATHAEADEPITLAQRQRLAMIINATDRSDEEVLEWLRRAFGITDPKPTRAIRRRDYDAICRAIEAPGALPETRLP